MNPGTPLPITVLNLTLVVMRFRMSDMTSSGVSQLQNFDALGLGRGGQARSSAPHSLAGDLGWCRAQALRDL
jgi:hypothetical protein